MYHSNNRSNKYRKPFDFNHIDFLPIEIMLAYVDEELEKDEASKVKAYLESNSIQMEVLKGLKLWRKMNPGKNIEDDLYPSPDAVASVMKRVGNQNKLASDGMGQPMNILKTEKISVPLPELDNTSVHYELDEGQLTNDELQFRNKLKLKLKPIKEVEAAIRFICEFTHRHISCRSASVFLYNKEGKIERQYISGFDKKYLPGPEKFSMGEGMVGKVVKEDKAFGELLQTNNLPEEINTKPLYASAKYQEMHTRAMSRMAGNSETVMHVIAAPINSFYRLKGVLRVINKIDREDNHLDIKGFNSKDTRRVQIIADCAAHTLQHLQMKKAECVLADIPTLLNTRNLAENQLFDTIAERLVRTTLYSNCTIRLADRSSRKLKLAGASSPALREICQSETSVDGSISGQAFFSDNYIIQSDLRQQSEVLESGEWPHGTDIVSMICFPLRSPDRQARYGSLCIHTCFALNFEQDDIDYLQRLVRQVEHLVAHLEDRVEQQCLRQISNAFIRQPELLALMKIGRCSLSRITGFDRCCFLMKGENDGQAIYHVNPDLSRGQFIRGDNPLVWRVEKATDEIVFIENLDEMKLKGQAKTLLSRYRSVALIPMKDKYGSLCGIIALTTQKKQVARMDEQTQLSIAKNLGARLNKNILFTIAGFYSCTMEREHERRRNELVANQLEETFKIPGRLIDKFADLFYIKDKAHKFLLVNKAQATVLGKKHASDAIGLTDMECLDSEEAMKFYQNERDLLAGMYGDQLHIEEQVTNQTTGEIMFLRTTKTLCRDVFGNIIGIIGIGIDITNIISRKEAWQPHIQFLFRGINESQEIARISDEYHINKDSIAILIRADHKEAAQIDAMGRIATAQDYINEQLPKNTGEGLPKLSLWDNFAETPLSEVLDEEFRKVITQISSVHEARPDIRISTSGGEQSLKVNKQKFQDLIIAIIVETLSSDFPVEVEGLGIEAGEEGIQIKATCEASVDQVEAIRKAANSTRLMKQKASRLYLVDKYLRDNYDNDLNIHYDGRQIIIEVPCTTTSILEKEML